MIKILFIRFLVLSFIFFPFSKQSYAFHDIKDVWLLIDTNEQSLKIKKGENTLATIKNISIGRNGAGIKQGIGDDITPTGTYKIKWINHKSKFYKFYGFDYPSIENANEGLVSGKLTNGMYYSIVKAHLQNKVPPQNTPLGGRLGIHGLGEGDKKIHQLMNWTHGCIALTNRQIDILNQWVDKDVLVIIK